MKKMIKKTILFFAVIESSGNDLGNHCLIIKS